MEQETCWTLIRAAASGDRRARSTFARSYLPVVRAYLVARWRGSPLETESDDVSQQVFLECFQSGGLLERADPSYPRGFQALLRGAVRKVALAHERTYARRIGRVAPELDDPEYVVADDTSVSIAFDRAFARRIMQEAGDRHLANARASGEAALRRVELIRLRFQEDLPIRDIAARLGIEPAYAHHQFAQGRKEFHQALREVVRFHDPNVPQIDRECRRLLELLLA